MHATAIVGLHVTLVQDIAIEIGRLVRLELQADALANRLQGCSSTMHATEQTTVLSETRTFDIPPRSSGFNPATVSPAHDLAATSTNCAMS